MRARLVINKSHKEEQAVEQKYMRWDAAFSAACLQMKRAHFGEAERERYHSLSLSRSACYCIYIRWGAFLTLGALINHRPGEI
jgi:hypothetical protein